MHSPSLSVCLQQSGPCTTECKAALKNAMKSEPCFSNEDLWLMSKWYRLPRTEAGKRFLGALATCEVEMYADALPLGTGTGTGNGNGNGNGNDDTGAAAALKSTSFVAVLACVLGALCLSRLR